MENLLDYNSYSLINAIAMSKTNVLKRIPADKDPAGKISFEYLRNIVCVEPKDFLKQLYTMHQDLQAVYSTPVDITINNQRHLVRIYQLLWGRMCIIAHFFYHNHPFWLKGAKEAMCSFLSQSKVITNDIGIAFSRIDMYYKKAAEFEAIDVNNTERISKDERIAQLEARVKELELQLADALGASTTEEPTEKELENTFTFPFRQKVGYSQMLDYLTKEAKTASDIQWARHALAIFENNPTVIIYRPADFKTWLLKFCELFGRKWVRDYEPQKLKKVKGKRAKPSKVTSFLPSN